MRFVGYALGGSFRARVARQPTNTNAIRTAATNTSCNVSVILTLHRRAIVPAVGAVAELVGIEGGVVSGVINLESSGVEASDWRPRHDEPYHEA